MVQDGAAITAIPITGHTDIIDHPIMETITTTIATIKT
jgi:hypothetical protein